MRLIDIDSFDEWHDDGWDLYAYRQDIDKMPAIDAEELYSMVFKSGYDKGLRDALKELSELICANTTRNDKPQTEYRRAGQAIDSVTGKVLGETYDVPQTVDWGKRKPCTLELFDDDGNYIEPKDEPHTDCSWKKGE